jgi:hypothetical protein
MRIRSAVMIITLQFVAGLAQAQEQPSGGKYFIWAGAGVSGYGEPRTNGISGFGAQIAPGKWLLTTMISTRQQSTISESYVHELATQGPVTLFGLGEIGIATGNDVAQFAIGAGGGVMIDAFKYAVPVLKDFQIALAAIITKPTDSPNGAVVKPVFGTGIIYRIGR